jgi:hypothetical protein
MAGTDGHLVGGQKNNSPLLARSEVPDAGITKLLAYDVEDHLTNSVDQNGVGISMTYDNLERGPYLFT